MILQNLPPIQFLLINIIQVLSLVLLKLLLQLRDLLKQGIKPIPESFSLLNILLQLLQLNQNLIPEAQVLKVSLPLHNLAVKPANRLLKAHNRLDEVSLSLLDLLRVEVLGKVRLVVLRLSVVHNPLHVPQGT